MSRAAAAGRNHKRSSSSSCSDRPVVPKTISGGGAKNDRAGPGEVRWQSNDGVVRVRRQSLKRTPHYHARTIGACMIAVVMGERCAAVTRYSAYVTRDGGIGEAGAVAVRRRWRRRGKSSRVDDASTVGPPPDFG